MEYLSELLDNFGFLVLALLFIKFVEWDIYKTIRAVKYRYFIIAILVLGLIETIVKVVIIQSNLTSP